MHGAPEGSLRPGADAGFRVGRDVGRVEHAERGCERVAAGEVLPTLGRVTLRAIAAARKRFAPGDQLGREAARSRPRDRSDDRPPRQHAKAREPETSESNDGDEQFLEHGVLRPLAMAGLVHLVTPWGLSRMNQDLQRTPNRCEATPGTRVQVHSRPGPRANNSTLRLSNLVE